MAYQYEYPRPAVSVDMVVFRKLNATLNVLLIQRKKEPFADCWALPGGFMDRDETLESAARRELQEETGLVADEIKQIHTFSAVNRDPRGRVVSVAFLAEVDSTQKAVAADDAKNAVWFPLEDLPSLAFDHDQMIQAALDRYELN